MIVIVDTPVWSMAYRRQSNVREELPLTLELKRLVLSGRAVMIGPVCQEILSGLRDPQKQEGLRVTLRAFDDLPLTTDDFECAARYMNMCRQKGVQGSPTDFLLCAVASRYDAHIFTTDRDFTLYAKHLKIRLYQPLKR